MLVEPSVSGLRLSIKEQAQLSQGQHPVPQYLLDWPTLIEPRPLSPPLAEVFRNVDVLDLVCPYQPAINAHRVALPGVRTETMVRTWIHSHSEFEIAFGAASTQVYFVDLPKSSTVTFRTLTARTVVVNLNCNVPALDWRFPTGTMGQLLSLGDIIGADVTLVFHLSFTAPEYMDSHDITLRQLFGRYWRSATLTLVGLEGMYDGKEAYDDLRTTVYLSFEMEKFKREGTIDMINNEVGALDLDKRARDRFAARVEADVREKGAVRFLTREEYEADVGADKFKLYTVWLQ